MKCKYRIYCSWSKKEMSSPWFFHPCLVIWNLNFCNNTQEFVQTLMKVKIVSLTVYIITDFVWAIALSLYRYIQPKQTEWWSSSQGLLLWRSIKINFFGNVSVFVIKGLPRSMANLEWLPLIEIFIQDAGLLSYRPLYHPRPLKSTPHIYLYIQASHWMTSVPFKGTHPGGSILSVMENTRTSLSLASLKSRF